MRIGPYQLRGNLILAPMAGVTDLPYRVLCRKYGASLAVSEMISSKPELQDMSKTLLRCDHSGEPEPRIVQIVGADPKNMADMAQLSIDRGAQIIDINMGCPAKKVCNLAAGSALLRDEKLVTSILNSVVKSVNVPVTLKMRTGWDLPNRNAVKIAKIAENCGIQALAIHGRTRSCGFSVQAEYQTIAETKSVVNIPVIANGDIDTPIKARQVLAQTGADALMIGRAALGRPWLFSGIQQFLDSDIVVAPPNLKFLRDIMIDHISSLYNFYGEYAGLRIARKHIGWYLKNFNSIAYQHRQIIYMADNAEMQLALIKSLFD